MGSGNVHNFFPVSLPSNTGYETFRNVCILQIWNVNLHLVFFRDGTCISCFLADFFMVAVFDSTLLLEGMLLSSSLERLLLVTGVFVFSSSVDSLFLISF